MNPSKLKDPSAPKCPFSRAEMAGLAKRFLKPEAYDPKRDIPVFYKLWAQFPSEAFWRVYKIPFTLRAAFWLIGKDGQEQLKRDWDVFHLELPKIEEVKLEAGKVGEDVEIRLKPRTVAELLR